MNFSQWEGNEKDQSGVATFSDGESTVSIKMDNFNDFYKLDFIIESIRQQEQNAAEQKMKQKIKNYLFCCKTGTN